MCAGCFLGNYISDRIFFFYFLEAFEKCKFYWLRVIVDVVFMFLFGYSLRSGSRGLNEVVIEKRSELIPCRKARSRPPADPAQ